MKWLLKKQLIFSLLAILILLSCSKNGYHNPSSGNTNSPLPTVTIQCDNRPVIHATLVPIDSLSEARIGLVSGTAGSKILFAGGMTAATYSSRVDLYDTITKTWSTAELTIAARQGMAVATVGNKIFFAGGGDNNDGVTTSRVDIYDASTNSWSIAELSKAREFIAAATLGNKIFFAGGGSWEPNLKGSTIVDIYDNSTNTWTTASLSEGRIDHSATAVNNKIYFAGGTSGYWTSLNILNTVDIYDGQTNSWSTSTLQEPRGLHASIATGNKIFWAGGVKEFSLSSYIRSDNIEIKDLTTGVSSLTCITPRTNFKAVTKGDNIIFFTGNLNNDLYSGTHFEIYNTTTNQWLTGVLNKRVNDATIISVNNTIYVAGGRDQPLGPYFKEVWKLEL